MEKLVHPNIIRFYRSLLKKGKLCLIMEFADGIVKLKRSGFGRTDQAKTKVHRKRDSRVSGLDFEGNKIHARQVFPASKAKLSTGTSSLKTFCC